MVKKRFFSGVNQAVEELRKEGISGIITEETLSARKTVLKDPEKSGKWIIFGPGMGRIKFEIAMRKSDIRLLSRNAIAIHIPANHSYLINPDTTISCRIMNAR